MHIIWAGHKLFCISGHKSIWTVPASCEAAVPGWHRQKQVYFTIVSGWGIIHNNIVFTEI